MVTEVGTQTVNATTASTSFTVNNDGSWYEYRVTATNQAGASAQSPLSTPPVHASAPPAAPTGVTAKATGQSNTIQLSFTAGTGNSGRPAISSTGSTRRRRAA